MKFTNLRDANVARDREWDPEKKIDLAWRANELGGEVGEALNVIKKLERERLGMNGSRATLRDLADELADVVICADLLAMTADTQLAIRVKLANGVPQRGKSLNLLGAHLFAVSGKACWAAIAMIETHDELANKFGLPIYLDGVVAAVHRIAERREIDAWSAIVAKFNASSEKVGLATRLG